MLEIGSKAPDFTLPNAQRQPVRLADLLAQGPVVLAFYPAAFSGVCDAEMCTFRDSLAAFNEHDATVVGISVDLPWSNEAFGHKHQLDFPLLSDFRREVIAAYDVAFENFAFIDGMTAAVRSVFVLDRGGIVRWAWAAPNPGVEPDYAAVKAAVASLDTPS